MRPLPEATLEQLTPEELAVWSQRGSTEAFARLVELFEARLFNFLLRRVGRRTDAEDLTQESFLRAWQRIASYKPRWRFSTWLYTIATRLAISHARRGRVVIGLGDGDSRPAPEVSESRTAEGSRVWKLVDEKLTAEQRTAVWLRYVEGLGIGEIGAVLGKSDVGVRVMLFRARAILAEHLEPREEKARDEAHGEQGHSDQAAVPEIRRKVAGGVR